MTNQKIHSAIRLESVKISVWMQPYRESSHCVQLPIAAKGQRIYVKLAISNQKPSLKYQTFQFWPFYNDFCNVLISNHSNHRLARIF